MPWRVKRQPQESLPATVDSRAEFAKMTVERTVVAISLDFFFSASRTWGLSSILGGGP